MTVSEHLAEYVLSVKEKQLPEKQINIARTFFIDAMACMFLGASSDSVKRAMGFVKRVCRTREEHISGP
ncbi:MAG: MmgE/PrpD family protein [Oscillospiraceae bacterium]